MWNVTPGRSLTVQDIGRPCPAWIDSASLYSRVRSWRCAPPSGSYSCHQARDVGVGGGEVRVDRVRRGRRPWCRSSARRPDLSCAGGRSCWSLSCRHRSSRRTRLEPGGCRRRIGGAASGGQLAQATRRVTPCQHPAGGAQVRESRVFLPFSTSGSGSVSPSALLPSSVGSAVRATWVPPNAAAWRCRGPGPLAEGRRPRRALVAQRGCGGLGQRSCPGPSARGAMGFGEPTRLSATGQAAGVPRRRLVEEADWSAPCGHRRPGAGVTVRDRLEQFVMVRDVIEDGQGPGAS